MTRCEFCRYGGKQHAPECPALTLLGSSERANYERGYRLGRSSRSPIPDDASPSFRMGWVNGNVAAEEWENGSPWSE
jgi:hypothetical protein